MSNTGRFIYGFLVGAAIGGAVGAIMAPKSGIELRKSILDHSGKAGSDIKNKLARTYNKAESNLKNIKEQVTGSYGSVESTIQDIQDRVMCSRGKVESAIRNLQDVPNQVMECLTRDGQETPIGTM